MKSMGGVLPSKLTEFSKKSVGIFLQYFSRGPAPFTSPTRHVVIAVRNPAMSDSTPVVTNTKKRTHNATKDSTVSSCSSSDPDNSGLARIGGGLLSTMGVGHSDTELKRMSGVYDEDFFDRMEKELADPKSPECDEKSPVKIARVLDHRLVRVCEIVPIKGYKGEIIALLFRGMYDLIDLIKRIPKEKCIHIGRQALHRGDNQQLVAGYLSHAKPMDGVDCDFTKFLPEDSVCVKAWVLSVPMANLIRGPFWPLMGKYGETFAKALTVATPKDPKLSKDDALALPPHEKCFHKFAFNCKFRDPVELKPEEFIAVANGVKAAEAYDARRNSGKLSAAVSPLVAAARSVAEGKVLEPIIL